MKTIFLVSIITCSISFSMIHQAYAPRPEGVRCGDVRPIPSPLKQLKLGTSVNDVLCHDGFVLLLKLTNGEPACVKPATKQKLIERGWAKPI